MCARPLRSLQLLGLCALLAASVSAQAVSASFDKDAEADVVFVHVNDFHGQFRPLEALWREGAGKGAAMVGGAASLAGYVEQVREKAGKRGARVVVTDAGDWFQGTLEGNSSKGRLAVEFLNRLALDASVLGNHEYDYGHDNLRELVGLATFPVLGANVLVAGAPARTRVAYAGESHVVEANGLKIVVVGLITSAAKSVSTGPFGDAEFEPEEQALAAVLPRARAQGDVVVLLSHCGLETDKRMAAAFPEIPLILGGHSHIALKTPLVEGKTWIVHTQGKATSAYRIDARIEKTNASADGKVERHLGLLRAQLVELDLAEHPEHPATAAWLRERTADLSAKWDRVIGELVTPLLDERGTHSTAAGNLLCDALIEATGADLAFSNKGGLRARLPAGPLTPRRLYELIPFDNTYVSMTLRGSDVRSLLRATLQRGRRLLDIGGGSYSYALVDGERELRAVTVGGQPLDDQRTYRIAVSSFLANGGDAYPELTRGGDRKDHGVLLRDMLIGKAERDQRLVVDTRQRISVDEGR